MLISNKVAFQLSTQITNKEGRYVLDVMSLLNVYWPPGQDKLLIKKQFNLIATEVSGILICGGDWNVQLHPILDSTNPMKKDNSESLHVSKMLKGIDIIDLWREFHPSLKQFTFFSHSHVVYSRIVIIDIIFYV